MLNFAYKSLNKTSHKIMETLTHTALKEIWIIDDNDIDVLIGAKTLERYDSSIQVKSFTKPLEALKVLQEKANHAIDTLPDLIFLDLYMPLVDGWQFLKEFEKIMEHHKHTVKIIVTSSTPNEQDIPKPAQHAEVLGHILKPLAIENIKQMREKFFA